MVKQVIQLLSTRAKNFNHNEDNTSGAFITVVLLETSAFKAKQVQIDDKQPQNRKRGIGFFIISWVPHYIPPSFQYLSEATTTINQTKQTTYKTCHVILAQKKFGYHYHQISGQIPFLFMGK